MKLFVASTVEASERIHQPLGWMCALKKMLPTITPVPNSGWHNSPFLLSDVIANHYTSKCVPFERHTFLIGLIIIASDSYS